MSLLSLRSFRSLLHPRPCHNLPCHGRTRPLDPATEAPRSRPSLFARVPPGGAADPDEILDRFVDWAAEAGFELYPAQEEALLEIMAGKHVILNTPTGSGKSLVALGPPLQGALRGARPPSTPAPSRPWPRRSSSPSATTSAPRTSA